MRKDQHDQRPASATPWANGTQPRSARASCSAEKVYLIFLPFPEFAGVVVWRWNQAGPCCIQVPGKGHNPHHDPPSLLTFHISLDVTHQGLDGAGEVPGSSWMLIWIKLQTRTIHSSFCLNSRTGKGRDRGGFLEEWHKGPCPITRMQSS